MNERGKAVEKPVSTREWYDFVGMLTDFIPDVHPGGREATVALLDMCQLDETSVILDVGCGAGTTACLIAKRYGARVYGIDLSEVMIEKAKAKASRMGVTDLVEFRVADAFKLPFEDSFFDGVILESVLTPLPGDKKQAMFELACVVRPGGWIAANEGTVHPTIPAEMLEAFEEHPAFYGYFTPQTLRALFEQAGLRVIEMKELESMDPPNIMKNIGCLGLLSFMIKVYPKILLKMLRDARFRKAQQVDDIITKSAKPYTGYVLIVGQKTL